MHDEHRAGVDLLVVLDRHLNDDSADAGGNRRHVRVHLRIISCFASRSRPQPDGRGQHRDDHRANRDANTLIHVSSLSIAGSKRTRPPLIRPVYSAGPTRRLHVRNTTEFRAREFAPRQLRHRPTIARAPLSTR